MTASDRFDVAIIGGGILGCSTALHLARGGMRAVVIERGSLCMAASSVNGGTLAMQTKTPTMIPYHLRALKAWARASEWLGSDVGFRVKGSLTLAFDDGEAELLRSRMARRIEAGAPVEFVGINRAREIEPGLTESAVLVSYCAIDGHANPTLTGLAFRTALVRAGVAIREDALVTGIERAGAGFRALTAGGAIAARRVVLAGGAWLERMAGWLGVRLPVQIAPYQMIITERTAPAMRTVVSVANALLTLKQFDNGTVLIGGGWKGEGDLERGGVGIIPERMVGNVRLARHVIPALKRARIARSWLGLSGNLPDWRPAIGSLPGAEGAFVIGCCRSGFTGAPVLGDLLAQLILGREPEMTLAPFDPGRYSGPSDARPSRT